MGSKVILLRGVPGSGKSTWVDAYKEVLAKYAHYVVVLSRDHIRSRLFGYPDNHGKDEERVSVVFNASYKVYLEQAQKRDDMTIIIDNTNCDWTRVEELAALAKEYDIPVEIVLIDTPLEEALRRNANRDRVVPEHVIERMHAELQATKDWTL
jgi:predicted kinase